MAPNVPVEGISAVAVGAESAEYYAAAAEAASPAGAAEAGSPEASRTTRASAPGAATTSIDLGAEAADGGATDQVSPFTFSPTPFLILCSLPSDVREALQARLL